MCNEQASEAERKRQELSSSSIHLWRDTPDGGSGPTWGYINSAYLSTHIRMIDEQWFYNILDTSLLYNRILVYAFETVVKLYTVSLTSKMRRSNLLALFTSTPKLIVVAI